MPWKKITAIFVLISLLNQGQSSLYAQPETNPKNFTTNIPGDLLGAELPKNLGVVQEVYRGRSDRTVVILQDAHSVPEAQENLRLILELIQKEHGVRLVGLEGASGMLDARFFKSFPDQELLNGVLAGYMQKGELSAGAAAAILNDAPAIYAGLEESEIYEEGSALYLQALGKQKTISGQIQRLEEKLEADKKRIYSPRLLEVDRVLRKFEKGEENIAEVIKALASIQLPEKESSLRAVAQELARENAADIENEVKVLSANILKSLEQKQEKQALAKFNHESQLYETSQISAETFAFYLAGEAARLGLSFDYSGTLKNSLMNQKKIQDIQGTQFFGEFERYVDRVKASIMQNPAQRVLDETSQRIALLGKMNLLELSYDAWEQFQSSGIDVWLPAEKKVMEGMRLHQRFYEIAEKRDQIFLKRLTRLMDQHEVKKAAILAGGFHAEGLTRDFREKEISYLLVMPRVSALPEASLYAEHMRGNVSWKKYFKVKNNRVNLYEAFVRAVRDELLSHSVPEASGLILKSWRDQLIRDLSAQKEITDFTKHSRFLDEKSPDAEDITVALWKKNIHSLVEGMTRLDKKGLLNESQLASLLKSSKTIAPAAGPSLVSPEDSVASSALAMSEVRASVPAASRVKPPTGSEKEIRERLEDGRYIRDEIPETGIPPFMDYIWRFFNVIEFDINTVPFSILAAEAQEILARGASNYLIYVVPAYYIGSHLVSPDFKIEPADFKSRSEARLPAPIGSESVLSESAKSEVRAEKMTVPAEDMSFKIEIGTSGWRTTTLSGFTKHNVARLAQAAAIVAGQDEKLKKLPIAIGYDARPNARGYALIGAQAIAGYGKQVTLIDEVTPTPVMGEITGHDAAHRYGLALHITASHNPVYSSLDPKDQWLGMKFMINGIPAPDEFTQKIVAIANDPAQSTHYNLADETEVAKGEAIDAAYDRLKSVFDIAKIRVGLEKREVKVAFNLMHGANAGIGKKVFPELGVDPSKIYNAGPMSQENTHPLTAVNEKGETVIWAPDPTKPYFVGEEPGADQPGILTMRSDGDADRLVVRDIDGKTEIEPNQLSLIIAHYLVNYRKQTGAIVRTVPTTRGLDRFAQMNKLPLFTTPVGSKNFAKYADKLLIGSEESGHIFFRIGDKLFADNSMALALLVAEIVGTTGKSLSEYSKEIWKEITEKTGQEQLVHYRTEVARALVTDKLKQTVLDIRNSSFDQAQFASSLAHKLQIPFSAESVRFDTQDASGFTVEFPNFWVMPRNSGTEPVIRIYVEAPVSMDKEKIAKAVQDTLVESVWNSEETVPSTARSETRMQSQGKINLHRLVKRELKGAEDLLRQLSAGGTVTDFSKTQALLAALYGGSAQVYFEINASEKDAERLPVWTKKSYSFKLGLYAMLNRSSGEAALPIDAGLRAKIRKMNKAVSTVLEDLGIYPSKVVVSRVKGGQLETGAILTSEPKFQNEFLHTFLGEMTGLVSEHVSQSRIERVIDLGHLTIDQQNYLRSFDNIFIPVLKIGETEPFVVRAQHKNVLGPNKGGFRLVFDDTLKNDPHFMRLFDDLKTKLTLQELRYFLRKYILEETLPLAFGMTSKTAVAGLPYGGGKGTLLAADVYMGKDGIPEIRSNYQASDGAHYLHSLVRGFARILQQSGTVSPDTDIPAADLNSARYMDVMADEHVEAVFEQLEKAQAFKGLRGEDLAFVKKLREIIPHTGDSMFKPYYLRLLTEYLTGLRERNRAVPASLMPLARSAAAYTSKSKDLSGSLFRPESTGFGGIHVLKEVVTREGKSRSARKPLAGMTAKLMGFGGVGIPAAEKMIGEGMKLEFISVGPLGGVRKKGGFSERDFVVLKKTWAETQGFSQLNSKEEYRIEGAEYLSKEQMEDISEAGKGQSFLSYPTDVFVLAAVENAIHVGNVVDTQADIYLELANGAITNEAYDRLIAGKHIVIPDTLANSGGVTVSYYEWLQNLSNERWDTARLQKDMEASLSRGIDRADVIRKKYMTDWRTAADTLMVLEVLEAYKQAGKTKKSARSEARLPIPSGSESVLSENAKSEARTASAQNWVIMGTDLSQQWRALVESNQIWIKSTDPRPGDTFEHKIGYGIQTLSGGGFDFMGFDYDANQPLPYRVEESQIEGSPYRAQFNIFRSLRPGVKPLALGRQPDLPSHPDKCAFGCQNPDMPASLLSRTPFLQFEVNGRKWDAFHNVSVFEREGHVIIVPHFDKDHQEEIRIQKMLERDLRDMAHVSRKSRNLLLFYNSPFAGASVNHIHFQGVYRNTQIPYAMELAPKKLLFESEGVRINSLEEYPARGYVFEGGTEEDQANVVFKLINYLQSQTPEAIPFNVHFIEDKIYLFPRNIDQAIVSELPGGAIASYELAGRLIITNEEAFRSLTVEKIEEALRKTTLSEEKTDAILKAVYPGMGEWLSEETVKVMPDAWKTQLEQVRWIRLRARGTVSQIKSHDGAVISDPVDMDLGWVIEGSPEHQAILDQYKSHDGDPWEASYYVGISVEDFQYLPKGQTPSRSELRLPLLADVDVLKIAEWIWANPIWTALTVGGVILLIFYAREIINGWISDIRINKLNKERDRARAELKARMKEKIWQSASKRNEIKPEYEDAVNAIAKWLGEQLTAREIEIKWDKIPNEVYDTVLKYGIESVRIGQSTDESSPVTIILVDGQQAHIGVTAIVEEMLLRKKLREQNIADYQVDWNAVPASVYADIKKLHAEGKSFAVDFTPRITHEEPIDVEAIYSHYYPQPGKPGGTWETVVDQEQAISVSPRSEVRVTWDEQADALANQLNFNKPIDTVVLIDDDYAEESHALLTRQLFGIYIQRFASGRNIDINIADNGQKGYDKITELVGRGKNVFVVTDQNMPVKKGIEMIQELRTAGYRVPVLLFSGTAADRDEILNVPNTVHIGKGRSLMAFFQNILSRSELRGNKEFIQKISNLAKSGDGDEIFQLLADRVGYKPAYGEGYSFLNYYQGRWYPKEGALDPKIMLNWGTPMLKSDSGETSVLTGFPVYVHDFESILYRDETFTPEELNIIFKMLKQGYRKFSRDELIQRMQALRNKGGEESAQVFIKLLSKQSRFANPSMEPIIDVRRINTASVKGERIEKMIAAFEDAYGKEKPVRILPGVIRAYFKEFFPAAFKEKPKKGRKDRSALEAAVRDFTAASTDDAAYKKALRVLTGEPKKSRPLLEQAAASARDEKTRKRIEGLIALLPGREARSELRLQVDKEIALKFAEKIRFIAAFGKPGSGKGTLLKPFVDKLNNQLPQDKQYVILVMGDIFRAAAEKVKAIKENRPVNLAKVGIYNDVEIPEEAVQAMESGKILSDELAVKVLNEALKLDFYKNAHGIFFDGFPRTLKQHEILESNGVLINGNPLHIDLDLLLDIRDNTIRERANKRRQDEARAADLEKRDPNVRVDDIPENVERRIEEYNNWTRPVAELKRAAKGTIVLDAELPADVVAGNFMQELQKRLPVSAKSELRASEFSLADDITTIEPDSKLVFDYEGPFLLEFPMGRRSRKVLIELNPPGGLYYSFDLVEPKRWSKLETGSADHVPGIFVVKGSRIEITNPNRQLPLKIHRVARSESRAIPKRIVIGSRGLEGTRVFAAAAYPGSIVPVNTSTLSSIIIPSYHELGAEKFERAALAQAEALNAESFDWVIEELAQTGQTDSSVVIAAVFPGNLKADISSIFAKGFAKAFNRGEVSDFLTQGARFAPVTQSQFTERGIQPREAKISRKQVLAENEQGFVPAALVSSYEGTIADMFLPVEITDIKKLANDPRALEFLGFLTGRALKAQAVALQNNSGSKSQPQKLKEEVLRQLWAQGFDGLQIGSGARPNSFSISAITAKAVLQALASKAIARSA